MATRKCIYCLNRNPDSVSHIIPECLGATLKLHNSVCSQCNHEIGKFEAKVCEDLHFYRWFLQLKTKGKIATTEAELHIDGEMINVLLRKGLEPRSEFIRPMIKEDGSERYFKLISDNPDRLEKQFSKYFEKLGIKFDRENVKLTKIDFVFPGEKINISSDNFKRMAAKIAFERFAQKRYQQAISSEFNHIRNYVKTGISESPEPAFLIYEKT